MKTIVAFVFSIIFTFALSVVAFCEEWTQIKDRHFIMYYKKAPVDFVETVKESAEEYYVEITKNLGFTRYKSWSWDDRAEIYIYDDQADYTSHKRHARWSHGVASPQERIIRTFPAAHGFFDSTLPHELTHIIYREVIGFKVSIPWWFEEGVAMTHEKAKRWGADNIVRKAIEEEKYVPLDELALLRPTYHMSQEEVSLYYSIGASAVRFLIKKHGEGRFKRFNRALKEKGSFKQALETVYIRYKNLKDLNKAYVRYLENE